MKAIELVTQEGKRVYVQVAEVVTLEAAETGGGEVAGGKVEAAVQQLGELGKVIGDVCNTIQGQIQTALGKAKPNEFTLEFGVTLGGEMGIPFVTKGTGEANFQVTAKWNS
jgi:hypothetical protein